MAKGYSRLCLLLLFRGVLLHYVLRRPSPVTAYCHAVVYSVTHRFDVTSVPLCVNGVPISHTGCALASSGVAYSSLKCPACSLPTTSIPTQPVMAMTNNTHAPAVLPPTTSMDSFPLHTLINPPCTIAYAPAAYANPSPPLCCNLKFPACSKTLAETKKPVVCHGRKRALDLKCMSETHYALERQRKQNAWRCHSCTFRLPSAVTPNSPPCTILRSPMPYLSSTLCPTMEL